MKKLKRISIPVGQELYELYDALCSIEHVSREDGFRMIFKPWVDDVINGLYMKPDIDIFELVAIETRVKELFQ